MAQPMSLQRDPSTPLRFAQDDRACKGEESEFSRRASLRSRY